MKIIWMLLGGHHCWMQRIGSIPIDFILLLPCGWLSINRLRLVADGGGGFRCDTDRDLETAPLAGLLATDIDSGFGKELDDTGLAADGGCCFIGEAGTDSLTVLLARTICC